MISTYFWDPPNVIVIESEDRIINEDMEKTYQHLIDKYSIHPNEIFSGPRTGFFRRHAIWNGPVVWQHVGIERLPAEFRVQLLLLGVT